ncbi:dynein axonemal assembly factor 6 [Wyeomyia smithii]|uniref:dynein axonemal assembly factor 6 n=1 Tax=Wyeomyia smithii TaxID=174621 RepID=UPI002467FBE6|nr:dynein axonemal assembly factor 6 [Wyeomyia smithii]XP_055542289.1 dynein axonemal assembly factor 6 [Wyeomyia smithii]XP_055542290.1 dynein axonemal assembly factor 6 [Wyeomyia smithii]
MSLLGAENIKLLKKLFISPNADSDSEDDSPKENVKHMGPGDIGSAKTSKRSDGNTENLVERNTYKPLDVETYQPKTLEEWEHQQEQEGDALLESRPSPDYRISYKQTVCTEDLYLQMNGKTPSTASCESMVVEIFLAGETVGIQHIDLSVQEQCVVVKSPKYFLKLQLPHRVNPDKGNAAWFLEDKTLKLTLKMERDLDFVNF